MSLKTPNICPVCGGALTVTRITCKSCKTEITGAFPQCRYCALDDRMKAFLEAFLVCRGSIKDIEKKLGVSYPTVKNMTEELLSALGLLQPTESAAAEREKILDSLEKGEITASEAAELLRSK